MQMQTTASEAKKFRNSTKAFIFYTLGQKRWKAIFSFGAITIAQCWSAFSLYSTKEVTNALGAENIDKVWFWTIILVVSTGLIEFFYRISGFIGMRLITGVRSICYNKTLSYLLGHSSEYFSNRFAGKTSHKISHITEGVHRILDSMLWNFYPMVIGLVWMMFLTFTSHTLLGFIFTLIICSMVFLNVVLSKRMLTLSKTEADRRSDLNGRMVDIITNILPAKQMSRLSYEEEGFDKYVSAYYKTTIKCWSYSECILVLNNVLISFLMATLLLGGVYFWQLGELTVGDIILLFGIGIAVIRALLFFGPNLNKFMSDIGEITEGLQDIFKDHQITDLKKPETVRISKGSIAFENVFFRYESEKETPKVFQKFNLKIQAEQKVGLVGESGAGKSTLVNLLLRFMDVVEGKICIDGQDIRHITQDDLRRNIAYVPQEPILFHRTLEENIRYGNLDASSSQIAEVTKKAHAHEFVKNFPEKYQTMVGERGIKLSGGQKQRIAIARAMLKNAPILILDEATSALDSKAEVLIQDSLKQLMKGRTTLVIAHRLSTLRLMDRIVVLDNGKIVEDGTHQELVAQKGKYAELWEHQSGGFIV